MHQKWKRPTRLVTGQGADVVARQELHQVTRPAQIFNRRPSLAGGE